jgi:hypothetical protein
MKNEGQNEEVYTCAPRAGAATAGYNGLIRARFDNSYTSAAHAVLTKGDTPYMIQIQTSAYHVRYRCWYSVSA